MEIATDASGRAFANTKEGSFTTDVAGVQECEVPSPKEDLLRFTEEILPAPGMNSPTLGLNLPVPTPPEVLALSTGGMVRGADLI